MEELNFAMVFKAMAMSKPEVIIELKSGETVKGVMKEGDHNLNIFLESVGKLDGIVA